MEIFGLFAIYFEELSVEISYNSDFLLSNDQMTLIWVHANCDVTITNVSLQSMVQKKFPWKFFDI